jgi:hypothetical protein
MVCADYAPEEKIKRDIAAGTRDSAQDAAAQPLIAPER